VVLRLEVFSFSLLSRGVIGDWEGPSGNFLGWVTVGLCGPGRDSIVLQREGPATPFSNLFRYQGKLPLRPWPPEPYRRHVGEAVHVNRIDRCFNSSGGKSDAFYFSKQRGDGGRSRVSYPFAVYLVLSRCLYRISVRHRTGLVSSFFLSSATYLAVTGRSC